MKSNIKNYFLNTSKAIENLSKFENKIIEISSEIIKCNKKNNRILVAGNGGSCSDAEHFSGELVCTFDKKNRKSISSIPLTSHSAAMTAWSNDFNFNTYFERQIESNGKKGDILFLLSTGGGSSKTGASMNLVLAAKKALRQRMKVISLLGKNGGILKKLSNISIVVDHNTTSIIQEAHMSILHCICIELDKNLK